jgi:hypothetical protein
MTARRSAATMRQANQYRYVDKLYTSAVSLPRLIFVAEDS